MEQELYNELITAFRKYNSENIDNISQEFLHEVPGIIIRFLKKYYTDLFSYLNVNKNEIKSIIFGTMQLIKDMFKSEYFDNDAPNDLKIIIGFQSLATSFITSINNMLKSFKNNMKLRQLQSLPYTGMNENEL